MAVRRIVINTATEDIDAARRFYGEILGLEIDGLDLDSHIRQ